MKPKFGIIVLFVILSLVITACSSQQTDNKNTLNTSENKNNSGSTVINTSLNTSSNANNKSPSVTSSQKGEIIDTSKNKYSTGATLSSSDCEMLSYELDDATVESASNPGQYIIQSENKEVVGTLVKIMKTSDNTQPALYTLTFEGVNYNGELYLSSTSSVQIPYATGKLYKIDISNINAQGIFIDDYFDKLIGVACK
jgi:hypothetical protein